MMKRCLTVSFAAVAAVAFAECRPVDPGRVPFEMAPIPEFVFPNRSFVITDYGATPGEAKCTVAFAKAIVACHAAGGGRVIVPKGSWHTGQRSKKEKKEKKYFLSSVDTDARMREYAESFRWLEESRIVNIARNATDPSVALAMSEDYDTQKLYAADTGLLVTQAFESRPYTENEIYRELLNAEMEISCPGPRIRTRCVEEV